MLKPVERDFVQFCLRLEIIRRLVTNSAYDVSL